jgi:DNA-directed RNA polymerase subunit RPC12/RpoP
MAVIVKCESCKTNFRVRDEFAGKQIQCPRCSKPLLVDGERVPNHDVFISYSHEDKAVADAVCVAFEAKGIRCWIAPRDIAAGASWAATIIDALENARVMVLIYSSRSNLSPQVVREVGQAVSKGAVIAPFCIEDAPMSKEMDYFLGASHWFDAINGATQSGAGCPAGFGTGGANEAALPALVDPGGSSDSGGGDGGGRRVGVSVSVG